MEFQLKKDFITLGQLLKAAALVSSGSEAKMVIQDGYVKVNHEVETRRGKKLHSGDVVEFEDEIIEVIS